MKLIPAPFVVLAFLLAPAGCGPKEPAALEPDELTQYAFRLPDGFDPQDAYPLVVALHGEGRDENEPLALWDAGAFLEPDFVLLSIRAPFRGDRGYLWFPDDAEHKAAALTGLDLVMGVIGDFETQVRIEPDWRFIFGISEAGSVAFFAALRRTDVFQGAAVLDGRLDVSVVEQRLLRNLDDMSFFFAAPQEMRRAVESDSARLARAGADVMLYPLDSPSFMSEACRTMQYHFGLLDSEPSP